MMSAKEYVEKARDEGKKIERRYCNGLDWLFIWENDGWISIINATNEIYGQYEYAVQAKDIKHAEEYISFMELPRVPFTVI